MNIVIIGASGAVGRRVSKEAYDRGHQVTAVARSLESLNVLSDNINKQVADVNNSEQLLTLMENADIIISAIRPSVGNENALVEMTKNVINTAVKVDARIIIAGGAARLKLDETSHETVLTAANFLPESIRPIAKACQKQFDSCLEEKTANWIYISPPAMLIEGERTGQYQKGNDTLVKNTDGNSMISLEDFAVAILDEVAKPSPRHTAFTVGYS